MLISRFIGAVPQIGLILVLCSCASMPFSHHEKAATCSRTPADAYGEPPAPIKTVLGNHFYSDENNSVVNEELYKKNEEARRPLRRYLDQIIKMTEAAADGDKSASLSVNKWLLHWAENYALTKVDSAQSGFERKWILSGILLSYIANKPYEGWEKKDKIDQWLNKLTHLMMEDYQSYQKNSQRNNHVYWAGLVALEMAAVNDDKDLLTWGLERVRFGLSQVDKDGFLPLELERKAKALQYHRVSLEALIMAAYLLKDRGFDLLNEKSGALDRLAQTTLLGLERPDVFEAKTGVAQEFQLKDSTAWLAVYDRLRPDNSKVSNLLKNTPPIWNRTLGGRPIELFEGARQASGRCETMFKSSD